MSGGREDRRRAVRIGYQVTYYVADSLGDHIPPVAKFREVRGHDLSPIGISFYAETAPKSEDLVLMFKGKDSQSYMSAKVVYHRRCMVDGERCFMVGCEFVRRLGDD